MYYWVYAARTVSLNDKDCCATLASAKVVGQTCQDIELPAFSEGSKNWGSLVRVMRRVFHLMALFRPTVAI